MSAERKDRELAQRAELLRETSEDSTNDLFDVDSDSSGNGTRFKERTGIYSLDFPLSPRVSKGVGKKSSNKKVNEGADVAGVTTTTSQASTCNGADLAGSADTNIPHSSHGNTAGKAPRTCQDSQQDKITENIEKKPLNSETDSDFDVPPSGTVALPTRVTGKDKPYFNILKGRFSRLHKTGKSMAYILIFLFSWLQHWNKI